MAAVTEKAGLQERLDELRERHGVPGASVAVLVDGEVAAAASGVLNRDTGVEATTDSLFQIGSISKVWTATLVMQLVEEGRLALDDPVRRHLPDFRVADEQVSEQVTIRHLLTHTSGIDGDHLVDTGRGDDVLERYVESCAGLGQVHPLGATMSYCNTGYSVLGRVVEVLAGSTWDEALQERLIRPLGLTHTATLPEDVLRHRAAIGHIRPSGPELQVASTWGIPRSGGPAGGICSTASELLEFAGLHLRDGASRDGAQLLGAEAARAMREPEVDVPSGGIGSFPGQWSLGWSLHSWNARKIVEHDGGTIGQSAYLRVVPDAEVAVALLTNGGDTMSLFRELGGGLLAEHAGVEMPPEPVPPEVAPPFDPEPYLGVYEREGASIEVVARDGGIAAIQTITGLAAEMSPDPVELPLPALSPADHLFLTRHPAVPDIWLAVRFAALPDGSWCMHLGGRATPRVAAR